MDTVAPRSISPPIPDPEDEVCTVEAKRVRDAYEALHEDFAAWTPSASFVAAFERGVIAEIRRRLAAGHDRPIRILEVGCGHGVWAGRIRDAFAGAGNPLEYTGVDLSARRVTLARARLADWRTATFAVADGEAFTPAAPVDLLLAIEVISHVPAARQGAWLERWRGWLSPGGCAVIIDKDKYSRHALKVWWDRTRRHWLPTGLRGKPYFPAHFTPLMDTLRYPSFRRLARLAGRARLAARPVLIEGAFHILTVDRPDHAGA